MGGGPHPPVELVLSWKANYVNPPTRGETAIVVQEVVLMLLCVISVALRVYTRKFLAKNFGMDDVLIIIALVWKPRSTLANEAKLTQPHSRFHWEVSQRFSYWVRTVFLPLGNEFADKFL